MSQHNMVGRFYILVGTRYMPARIGTGTTDDTVKIRSLTSDVILGDLDSIMITASLAAHVKDHGRISNLTLTTSQVVTYGDWRASTMSTVGSFILTHGNCASQRDNLIAIFGIENIDGESYTYNNKAA